MVLTTQAVIQHAKNTSDAKAWRRVPLRDVCVYCGELPTTIDHLVPRASGGITVTENIAPAYRPCNERKADRHLLFFLAGIPKPGERSRKHERRERDRIQQAKAAARLARHVVGVFTP